MATSNEARAKAGQPPASAGSRFWRAAGEGVIEGFGGDQFIKTTARADARWKCEVGFPSRDLTCVMSTTSPRRAPCYFMSLNHLWGGRFSPIAIRGRPGPNSSRRALSDCSAPFRARSSPVFAPRPRCFWSQVYTMRCGHFGPDDLHRAASRRRPFLAVVSFYQAVFS